VIPFNAVWLCPTRILHLRVKLAGVMLRQLVEDACPMKCNYLHSRLGAEAVEEQLMPTNHEVGSLEGLARKLRLVYLGITPLEISRSLRGSWARNPDEQ